MNWFRMPIHEGTVEGFNSRANLKHPYDQRENGIYAPYPHLSKFFTIQISRKQAVPSISDQMSSLSYLP